MNAEPPATAPGRPDPLDLIRAVLARAELRIRAPLGHTDALTLLYAAVTGEHRELGRLVRGLLLMHQVLPGTGRPWPGCTYCHGAGETPAVDDLGPRHCHCRCDLCTCNDPVCAGPCDSLAVMLDALVLHGTPAAATDVPRTLAALHLAGARRIVANNTSRQQRAIVDPVDDQPGTARITVSDPTAAERIDRALRAEGYQCEQQDVPGQVDAVRLIATHGP